MNSLEEQLVVNEPASGGEDMPFYLPGSHQFVQALQLFLRHTTEYESLHPWYVEFLHSLPHRRTYLDVGAGDGSSLTAHADRNFDFGVLIEKDQELRPALQTHCPKAQVLSCDWDEVSEDALVALVGAHSAALAVDQEGLFDLVQLVHMLYYFSPAQQRALLRRCARLVRPGGALLLCLQDESSDLHVLYHTFARPSYNLRLLGEWFAAEFGDEGWQVTSEVLPASVATERREEAQEIAEFTLCYLPFESLPKRAAIAQWVEKHLWRADKQLYFANNPQRVVVCQRAG